jgi:hypothetical protein
MIIPALLLLLIGVLGATDIWLFHTRAHHLHEHPPARAELITHALRGPTYAVLFLLIPNFTCHGAWFVALIALLIFDLGISIADFWLEPARRRALGGLPRGEYLLHVVLALLFGGMCAAIGYECRGNLGEPTALRWIDDGVPTWLRIVFVPMATGVLWSGISDFLAVRKLSHTAP